MSWLVRIEIGADAVRSEGILDSYCWHKKLWECYPDMPESRRDFLTRIDQLEGAFRIWMMAERKPVLPRWCPSDAFSIKEIVPSFFSHQYYAFDLRANPVKAIVQKDLNGQPLLQADGKRKRGKRVPLVKLKDLRAWLVQKGNVRCRDKITGLDVPGGFKIVQENPLEISPMIENHFFKKGLEGCHGGVEFRGTLEVTDRKKFIDTYHAGIGSAKGFGFGLLLLAPVNL
ncbi:MAG: type I-E CRISPR-associated protein Cas6/Cse3/CasE [Candidatus Omnitrophota bacterium]